MKIVLASGSPRRKEIMKNAGYDFEVKTSSADEALPDNITPDEAVKYLAEIKGDAVKVDEKPLTIDDIIDSVCNHFNVTVAEVNGRSRKRDYVMARQVSMFLAQKYTKMPASRIGKLVGGRDHSTVIHSCAQIERRLKTDANFSDEIQSIENSFKLKKA